MTERNKCDDHDNIAAKNLQTCLKIAHIEEKQASIDREQEFMKSELLEGPESIKSRTRATEVRMDELKFMVKENREIVGKAIAEYRQDTEEKLKGIFRIFILAFSAAMIILTGVLSFMTFEIRSINQSVISHIQEVKK